MQSSARLSDRDAAEAVRTRIDWKYLLGLELSDSGFDYSILSRFRDRLIEGHAEMSLLDRFLDKCKSLGMLRDRSDMRTDSTHVVASIRNMNRSELVGETLRATLNVLSTADPQWVAANVDASWYLKYARRFGYPRETLSKEAIIAAAEGIGRDGIALLARIWSKETPLYMRSLPAVEILRQCWISQFWTDNGVLRWRHAGNLPPVPLRIDSPFDVEARYSIKRSTEWIGYSAIKFISQRYARPACPI
jgi:transposase